MSLHVQGHTTKTKIPYLYHPHCNEKRLEPHSITNAFSTYYKDLYNLKDDSSTHQPSQKEIQTFLDNTNLPSITAQLLSLNEPFTISEILQVINNLPNSKSPGPDGFTGEYYKIFQNILAPILCHTFNSATKSESFPAEMLSAMVVTLPKPGKEPTSPKNFRPISLLNLDLQIYAKLIANRLKNILPFLIHKDQSGFTKGRQASDATRRMINIIHHVESTKTPSLFLFLDAEKAFDRVHWGYISSVLHKFGLQGQIHNAIMALYSTPSGVLSREPFCTVPNFQRYKTRMPTLTSNI